MTTRQQVTDLAIKGAIGIASAIAAGTAISAAIRNKRPFKQALYNKILVFPNDLETKFPLSMRFEFKEYKRRSIFNQPFEKSSGIIRLPIPKNIQDKFQASWKEHDQGTIVGAAVENLIGYKDEQVSLKEATGGIAQALGIVGSQTVLSNLTAALGNLTKGSFAEGKAPEAADLLQPLGLAINPFLTVMFDKPTFKRHSFNWKLIPRNPDEAQTINSIITSFKYAMLPDIASGTGGTLLNYPDTVQISFYNSDSFLYRFKPCVVTNMSVNYAPTGPSFFRGTSNVPTEIDFSIDLLEIEYWTKESVAQDAANSEVPFYTGAAP